MNTTNYHHRVARNKRLFTALGIIGLFLTTGTIVLHRGFLLGINSFDFFHEEDNLASKATGKDFTTQVVYIQPFQSTEPSASTSGNEAAVVMSESGFFDYFRWFFGSKSIADDTNYRPVVPTYNDINSLVGNTTITGSPETTVNDTDDRRALGYTGQRKIAVDTDGNISIAYRRPYQDYQQIFVSELRKLNTGYILVTPTQPLSVRMLGITQRVPAIAIDGKGSLQVVWYGSENEEYPNRRQINHAETKGSKSFWRQNDLVSYVEGYSSDDEYWQEHPSIVVGEYDNLYVVWEGKDEENDKPQVKFSRSFDGGSSWSDWKNIHPSTQYTYSRPTLVYTQDKTLHLFAYSSDNVTSGTNQIQYAYSTDLGVTWSDWKIISNGTFDARHISATAVNGTPVIAYRAQTKENGPSQIMTQIVTTTQTSVPRVIYPSENYQFFPSITAIKDTNMICVTWIEENTSSDFPNEDPTDGDVLFSCQTIGGTTNGVFNLSPEGSHLYPVLPLSSAADYIPIAYYDDEKKTIVMRLLSLQ